MRILSIGNLYPPVSLGGYELVWRSGVEYLRGRGHDVRVLTSDHRARDGEPGEVDVHRELRLYWAEHKFPRLSWRERLQLERHNAAVLARQADQFAPDAVNWWAMGGMSLSLIEQARRRGLGAAGVVCDDWMLYGPRVDAWSRPFLAHPRLAGVAERISGRPARLRLAAAGTWLFLSETVRRRALASGVEITASEICNRGPDDGLFSPRRPQEWRWRLLYIGRIDERKGIDTAIEALAKLPAVATLVIDGSGDDAHRAELEALAAQLGVREQVEFQRSPRDRVPDVYADADAVLFPVRWDEPWGLVPLEAMAVGRPVLATGRGGSGEYLRNRENALLFEPSDSAAVARAVRELADDYELRERLRTGGFETASRFSERGFNEQIERALERVA